MPPTEPPLLLSVPDACTQLGTGRSMLYGLIASGDIEIVKIGRRTLIPRDSLMRFVSRLVATQPALEEPRPAPEADAQRANEPDAPEAA